MEVRAINRETLQKHAAFRVQKNVVCLGCQQVVRLRIKIAHRNDGLAAGLEGLNRLADFNGLTCRGAREIFELQHQRRNPLVFSCPAYGPHQIIEQKRFIVILIQKRGHRVNRWCVLYERSRRRNQQRRLIRQWLGLRFTEPGAEGDHKNGNEHQWHHHRDHATNPTQNAPHTSQ